jgi:hypothetical protein
MPEVIYDKTFYQDGTEVRAVIMDYSDPGHIELRFGITERIQPYGGKEVVTYHREIEEECTEIPTEVRQVLWRTMYQQVKEELDREIQIATDPHYDLPEREIY